MKRFHLHLHVGDLDQNAAFYSRLYGQAPTRVEADYANHIPVFSAFRQPPGAVASACCASAVPPAGLPNRSGRSAQACC